MDDPEALRRELQRLDAELAEATHTLQLQRAAFANQVAEHDEKRSLRAKKVQLALQELEAERGHMDQCHKELEEETQVAKELEALCEQLETSLDRSRAEREEELEASLGREEVLLAAEEQRLKEALAQRAALAGRRDAKEGRKAKARSEAAFLRRAVEELAQESEHQAQAVAARAERHLEDTVFRASAMAASTKALSKVRRRNRGAWDAEVASLLDALQEVEDLTARLLQRSRRAPEAEVATLRHSVGAELRTGFAAALVAKRPA
ncbi:unnamed protein product [Effrenium voratum]|uniref:Uncharacterized protein n=1 Tax=Effrenium voratum TaxID=2562239 RepID=A0AA36JA92_9DINO|nr:unnamed protein product [Effrenium voratum]CAJ1420019.1 unnamed protein product [Effrenium voratum]CAJ1446720.1 unnamed protein product [Effrenium voratum]